MAFFHGSMVGQIILGTVLSSISSSSCPCHTPQSNFRGQIYRAVPERTRGLDARIMECGVSLERHLRFIKLYMNDGYCLATLSTR